MLTATLLSLAILALPSAQAGKLSEGFRGHPFGDASWLATAPGLNCASGAEVSVAWLCQDTIGKVPVSIAYMVDEGVYLGVYVQAKGFQAKQDLLATLKGAWGPGMDGGPGLEGLWKDGDVFASFKYNRYSDDMALTIASEKANAEVKRRKAERVKSAAGDL